MVLPFEIWTLKSLVFKCFRYSGVQYSDGYCNCFAGEPKKPKPTAVKILSNDPNFEEDDYVIEPLDDDIHDSLDQDLEDKMPNMVGYLNFFLFYFCLFANFMSIYSGGSCSQSAVFIAKHL